MSRHVHTTVALMVIAATAFLGWAGAANAAKSTVNHRMVQQTDQSSPRSTMQEGPSSSMQSGIQLPQGITTKDLGASENVRSTFSDFAQSGLKKDNFKKLRRFISSNPTAIGCNLPATRNLDAWNKAIDDFDQAWKAKYNSKFDVNDKDKALLRALFERRARRGDRSATRSHIGRLPRCGKDRKPCKKLPSPPCKKGRGVAIADLHGSGSEAPLRVSLVREGRDWKIDIPDNVTADDLKASVARHLTEVLSTKDQWPSDPNDAARVVTYHILQGVYTAGQGGQMGTMGEQKGQTHEGSSPSPDESHQSDPGME